MVCQHNVEEEEEEEDNDLDAAKQNDCPKDCDNEIQDDQKHESLLSNPMEEEEGENFHMERKAVNESSSFNIQEPPMPSSFPMSPSKEQASLDADDQNVMKTPRTPKTPCVLKEGKLN